MTLYNNRYRIESTRLKGYDYSQDGCYFVTICTFHMHCYFGEVISGEIKLSDIGRVVEEEWNRNAIVRQNVELDEWIIMPNHIHGIIRINDSSIDVDTRRKERSPNVKRRPMSKMQKNSLGSIINQFKGVCKKRIVGLGYSEFAWQPRYHDRIIRDSEALNSIRNYIRNNPLKWGDDAYHPAKDLSKFNINRP